MLTYTLRIGKKIAIHRNGRPWRKGTMKRVFRKLAKDFQKKKILPSDFLQLGYKLEMVSQHGEVLSSSLVQSNIPLSKILHG